MSRRILELTVSRKSIEARNQAIDLMVRHGLSGWLFALNSNVTRAGVCFYPTRTKPGRIELSVHFIERNTEEDVLDTTLHEIAHALAGVGHGHDDVWKEKCRMVGAKPERCYGEGIKMPKGKWTADCKNCGKIFFRHRRPAKLVGWSCTDCGREKGAFIWGPTGQS